MNKEQLKLIVKRTLPIPVRNYLKSQWQRDKLYPPFGKVGFGNLRSLKPISDCWGIDRGQPVDRYYIENFLADHSSDIQGRVLEIGDNSYTLRFGGDNIKKSDVLHAIEGNPEATIVGDLSNANHIPSDTFDCFILTQTLQYVYDLQSGLKTIYRILKPGGIVLATLPSITPLSDAQWNKCWYWGFTTVSTQRLFEEVFTPANIQVKTYGNVLTASAFLQGLASQELRKEELDYRDSNYEVTITVRAVKPQVMS
ncbi:class I SAM-dependent methyltransferase [Nostoc sphaeroides]|uniref:Class I SAM-dependent methyltransferase n=1 Tax=Nostoc sphaeroides CCNUC1 TaxID=2653204 RepID=A0A5P8WCN5_9NOSO|nr:methyltransferase domain-containing protein [Nostoc sphaeroides]QFS50341.1 class I SAM-dependent methyltransferase [Nostoc sphaeroides CCNUC1]